MSEMLKNLVHTDKMVNTGTFREVSWNGFMVKMFLPFSAGPSAEFTVKEILRNDTLVWGYESVRAPGVIAILNEHDDELVIVVLHMHTHQLLQVIRVADTPQIWIRNLIGVQNNVLNIEQSITMKRELASKLKLEAIWTKEEEPVVAKQAEAAGAARAQEEAKRKAEIEAKRKAASDARHAKVVEIMGRQQLYVYTPAGAPRNGYPVEGDEWKLLSNRVFCIAVESYNQTTGEYGNVLESFMVKKSEGGRVSRDKVTQVFPKKPVAQGETKQHAAPKADVRKMKVKGEEKDVLVVTNTTAVHALNQTLVKAGFGEEVFVLVEEKDRMGNQRIDCLSNGEIRTVTHVRRVQLKQEHVTM